METLKIIIPGEYYDSQIHSGYLYLWSIDGHIITLDWNKLIESITIPDRLNLAMWCAFRESEYLYGKRWKPIFNDREFFEVLIKKFEDLSKQALDISPSQFNKCIIKEQSNPFPFPHSDTNIHWNKLYVGSRSGIREAACNLSSQYPISKKSKVVSDIPVLGLSAANQILAIAAGDEGLFEYNFGSGEANQENKLTLRLKEHSNLARWLYTSLFSSSYFNEGFLADFIEKEPENGDAPKGQRTFLNTFSANQIFSQSARNGKSPTLFTWGVQDKICRATRNAIEIIQYNPFKGLSFEQRFKTLGSVDLENPGENIVTADSALFGYIIESDEGLLVINSLLERMWLPGEPVNWRVFPKSRFYTNQLHVIYEDHLQIHSFNQDYFVDQKEKKVGISYPTEVQRYQYSHAA